jgi:hypothetical protein
VVFPDSLLAHVQSSELDDSTTSNGGVTACAYQKDSETRFSSSPVSERGLPPALPGMREAVAAQSSAT